MFQARLELLRQQGIKKWEGANYEASSLVRTAFPREAWAIMLRRSLRQMLPSSALNLRRVGDIGAEWDAIWQLLRGSSRGSETEVKRRTETALNGRGAAFVAGEKPAGVVIGRLAVDPGFLLERVGVVMELAVSSEKDDELSEALLGRLEGWLSSKQATEIETPPVRDDEYRAWLERDFKPHMIWLQGSVETSIRQTGGESYPGHDCWRW